MSHEVIKRSNQKRLLKDVNANIDIQDHIYDWILISPFTIHYFGRQGQYIFETKTTH